MIGVVISRPIPQPRRHIKTGSPAMTVSMAPLLCTRHLLELSPAALTLRRGTTKQSMITKLCHPTSRRSMPLSEYVARSYSSTKYNSTLSHSTSPRTNSLYNERKTRYSSTKHGDSARSHLTPPQTSSSNNHITTQYRSIEYQRESQNEQHHITQAGGGGGALVIGLILTGVGLVGVPMGALGVWIAATSLELGTATASLVAATAVNGAPYAAAAAGSYAAYRGGDLAVRRSRPWVVAVIRNAQQTAADIRGMVLVIHRDRSMNASHGQGDTIPASNTTSNSAIQSASLFSRVRALMSLRSVTGSAPATDMRPSALVLTHEEARVHRDQNHGDEFAYVEINEQILNETTAWQTINTTAADMGDPDSLLNFEPDTTDAIDDDYVHIRMIDNDTAEAPGGHSLVVASQPIDAGSAEQGTTLGEDTTGFDRVANFEGHVSEDNPQNLGDLTGQVIIPQRASLGLDRAEGNVSNAIDSNNNTDPSEL
jgi:hypothetical protein